MAILLLLLVITEIDFVDILIQAASEPRYGCLGISMRVMIVYWAYVVICGHSVLA